jgi:hypothetical protein
MRTQNALPSDKRFDRFDTETAIRVLIRQDCFRFSASWFRLASFESAAVTNPDAPHQQVSGNEEALRHGDNGLPQVQPLRRRRPSHNAEQGYEYIEVLRAAQAAKQRNS